MTKKINSKKSSRVEELKKLLDNSKSVAVVDYKGLKVSQATELRRLVKKAGGEVKIDKNTLFKIASGNQDLKLEGLSAFIFSNTDEISALKAAADYSKKNTILSFKLGLLNNKILSAAEILALANTPSKETSIAKILYLLNFNISKLVRTLDALAKKEVTN